MEKLHEKGKDSMTAEEKNDVPLDTEQNEAAEEGQLTLDEEQLRQICLDRFCSECPELAQKQDELLRLLADTDNFKKRLIREKEEFFKFAAEGVIADLLPVLDNLDLALVHGRENPACKDLVQGVEMTRSVFLDTLKRHGLEYVGSEGQPFDPALHEAVGQEEREDMEEGSVCRLIQKGYKLKERLIRPARVLVSRKCS
jgi:molecular chaperone GrpE